MRGPEERIRGPRPPRETAGGPPRTLFMKKVRGGPLLCGLEPLRMVEAAYDSYGYVENAQNEQIHLVPGIKR